MNYYPYVLAGVLLLQACADPGEDTQPATVAEPEATAVTVNKPAEEPAEQATTDTAIAVDRNKTVASMATSSDPEKYPSEEDLAGNYQIQPEGRFHNDEVTADLLDAPWIGLMLSDHGVFLEETEVALNYFEDIITGSDSGKIVYTPSGSDTAMLLLRPADTFSEGMVDRVFVSDEVLAPGDTLPISMAGQNYRLFATGRSTSPPEGEEYAVFSNYRLYLANHAGATQLVAAIPFFDDAQPSIWFIGDLDGDKQPDLLLDITYHYNVQRLCLYLSGEAKEGELVAPVAIHHSTGC